MKPVREQHHFIGADEFHSLLPTEDSSTEIVDVLNLGSDGFFLSILSKESDTDLKVSIGIASAVTAYARIAMSRFKNRDDLNLYYTDTDSIYINRPLESELVDPKTLGLFKLENIFTDIVFLGPKIYAGKTVEGNSIIKIKGYKDSSQLDLEFIKPLLNECLRPSHITLKHKNGLELWIRMRS